MRSIKHINFISSFLILAMFALGCARKPYDFSRKIYKKQLKEDVATLKNMDRVALQDSSGVIPGRFIATVNYGLRKPNFVVIHHTAQKSTKQTLHTFTLKRTQVSAHYVIGRDGEIHQMLNDYLRAWHAGRGKWGKVTDMNSISIGIELDNNGFEPFADEQINSLLVLLDTLKSKYNIPAANFIGHSDLAPTRKQDPNANFPWELLAKKGFGLWYDNLSETPPENINVEAALRLIGYDTSNLEAAIIAFKRHFVQSDVRAQMTEYDKLVLYNVSLE